MTTRTDRELLELAAKATGLFVLPPKGHEIPGHLPVCFTLYGKPWIPLTDNDQPAADPVYIGGIAP